MSEGRSSFVYGLYLCFCVGCVILLVANLPRRVLARPEPPKAQPVWDVNGLALPAPSDIQELLNRLEPEPRLKVDGRIGPATIEKWERVYSQVSANQYFGK